MTFVVLGTLFLRSSLIIVFIGFFTVMFGWEIYQVVNDKRTYFESDFDVLQRDGFAINTSILIVWINVWVINNPDINPNNEYRSINCKPISLKNIKV